MKGEKARTLDKETIVVKTHRINRLLGKLQNPQLPQSSKIETKMKGCVFIIRSPRDAILAEFTRKQAKSHVGGIDLKLLQTENWKRSHQAASTNFHSTYTQAYQACQANVHLIFYEDLKESEEKLLKVMEGVSKYLNEMNPGHRNLKFRKDCLERNFEGNYHRKSKREWDVGDYFTSYAKDRVNNGLNILNATFGYVLPGSYRF